MLYIKADEPRTITFEVDIRGVGQSDLKGYVRLFINDVEHGFPVSINEGIITADIPPLINHITFSKNMDDGNIIEAKLELMTDQHIFTPWAGEIKVSVPMDIKAKLSLSNEGKKVSSVSEPIVAKVVETKEDKDSVKEELTEFDTSEEKMLQNDEKKYKDRLMTIVADTIKQMGLVPASQPEALMEEKVSKPKVVKEVKKISEKELMKQKLKNITEEGIYKYMQNAGTKNPKIQELVYEQAVAAAGTGEPFEVLKQVVKILKKRR